MAKTPTTPHLPLSRRKFLQYSAGASLLLGTSPLLPARWSGQAEGKPSRGPSRTEARTYVFNLSHMDTSRHDLILVAGTQRVKLKNVTPAVRNKVRQDHPLFNHVPDHHLTHHLTLAMPAEAVQLCYVQRVERGKKDGSWDMAHLFYHHPAAELLEARQRRFARALRPGNTVSSVSRKWHKYAITPELLDALNDPVGEEVLQDTHSHAVALVAGYPELVAGEPNSAAHIQTNIIATELTTDDLADSLTDQGPATQNGGWATLKPLINPDTDQPYLNSQGQIQYFPLWSKETGESAGKAILPSLDVAKDDPDLGVNITDIDPNDPTAPTNGAIWTLHDGMPTVDHSPTGVMAETKLAYQLENQTPGHGYALAVEGTDGNNKTVTFSAKNWFVRFLGLHVRYLNGSGQPIPLSNIINEIQDRLPPMWNTAGTYDVSLGPLGPEWVIIGIPVRSENLKLTVPIPTEAAAVQILAGGLGSGANPYPDTLADGICLTVVFNLAIPALLLALNAAAGYARVMESLKDSAEVRGVLEFLVGLMPWTTWDWNNLSVLQDLGFDLEQRLLNEGADILDQWLAEAVAVGEVEDAFPVIGMFLSAIWAVGLIASIAETSAEVAQSPKTYVNMIKFTHDINVKIIPDPTHKVFPAVATHFTVTALFDKGTPRTLTQDLPGGTVSTPITVPFKDVPAGGNVEVVVDFYSVSQWLAGHGSTGEVSNTATQATLDLEITIKENLVPLTANTTYSHKEIIVLDSSGNHKWLPTTTAPSERTPDGLCQNVNGQICSWTGITVSTINAAVGYAWQAYNTAVRNCASGAVGQLSQFANLSVTENPQSGYFAPSCGFSGTTRIVYDQLGNPERNFYLDTTDGKNYIRQIRLTDASFDGPTSNKAWGRLRWPSDALLLHRGRIISVSTKQNKMEVLDLPPAATTDAKAPFGDVRSGVGTREGLMKGPVLAAVTKKGTILVIEAQNNRIQAFDLEGHPVLYFAKKTAYFVPLRDEPTAYLDIAVEHKGYMYVLSYTRTAAGAYVYRLDLYEPEGTWLARTTGVNAAKLAVNAWRELFTLNYQVLKLPPNNVIPNKTEPSVSHWIPST